MNNSIFVENINEIYDFSKFLIYENNFILGCPEQLKDNVSKIVLKLTESGEFEKEIKIKIKDILNEPLLSGFSDDGLYQDLLNLFKNKDEAFINVKISKSLFDEKGRFDYPKEFSDGIDQDTLHFKYPRIKPLIINKNINDAIQKYNDDIKFIDKKYKQMQKALENFKENIINFNDFGTITIYPENCTTNDNDLDKPTINEAVEHECQHLCIFLLSLAKTYIWFGLHFSKNIKKSSFSYELKETEFITLFGSFCNILIRIYKNIKGEKDKLDFIKTLLNICIYEKRGQNEKYENALTSCAQFERIKNFFKSIYKDSLTSLKQKNIK